MWAPTLSVSLREITSTRDEEAAPVSYQRPQNENMGVNPRDNVDLDPLTFGLSLQSHNQNIIVLLSDPSSKQRRAQFEKLELLTNPPNNKPFFLRTQRALTHVFLEPPAPRESAVLQSVPRLRRAH